jgi:tripartite-type tricarboxylate transporter receptor subunit TctC
MIRAIISDGRELPMNFMSLSRASIAATVMIATPAICMAQAYPSKPVRVLVPFPAGSVPDLVARLAGEKMSIGMGQPLIVENRIGAGGRIAAEAVARAAPDGYTLVLGTASTHIVGPLLVRNMPYDPVKDFTPISIAVNPVSGVVTSASVPAKSVQEMVAYARANPGKMAYGSNGIGSSHHLVGELIKIVAGIDMLHVPLAGSNEVLTAVLTDQVQLAFSSPGTVQQYTASGKVKLLAVVTPRRFPGTPNVPTLAESLPGYEPVTDWFGYFGPAGLSQPVVARLHGEIVKGLNAPDVRAKLENATQIVVASTPEEMASLMKREAPIYQKIIKTANIPVN